MERSCRIILILIIISLYDIRLSSGNWIEIDGCHSLLSAAIQNRISLPANEPGVCLEWCGTKTVALQHSTCFCVNDSLARKLEYTCSQNCPGDVHLKCGGTIGDLVSVYKARNDINAEWGSIQGTGCLTYKHTSNEIGGTLVPDKCTVRHPFFCYSEMAYSPQDCYRHSDINDQRTWYEALEACRSRYPQLLWPSADINNCSLKFIAHEIFWVAVYQWTKPTSSSTITMSSSAISKTSTMLLTSTLIKANTSTAPVTLYTLPASKTSSTTLATTSTTFTTSSPSSSTSTSFTNPATTTTTSTTSTPSASTSSIKRAIILTASTSSSPFTSTNSTTKVSGTSINPTLTTSKGPSTSKGDPTSSYITVLTKPALISTTTPKSTLRKSTTIQGTSILTNRTESSTSAASSFAIDLPNLAIGIAIGSLAGLLFLIIIIIVCRKKRICARVHTGMTDNNDLQMEPQTLHGTVESNELERKLENRLQNLEIKLVDHLTRFEVMLVTQFQLNKVHRTVQLENNDSHESDKKDEDSKESDS